MLIARELKRGSRVERDGDAAGLLIEGLEGTRSVLFNGRCLSMQLPRTEAATVGTGEAVRMGIRDGRSVARAGP